MNKPTPEEIRAEIAALKNLTPVGQFKRKTAAAIQIQIDALAGEIDDTSAEFDELDHEAQMTAVDALNWKNGQSKTKPSEDWGSLVE